MTTLAIRNSINRSPLRLGFLLIPLVLACFGLSPIAQAADGDLGKGNTSEGASALQSLTTGIHNTAIGELTLSSNTTNNYNTATGSQALKNNTADNNTADGFQALVKNTTGADNAATGWRALFQNTTGSDNTANGLSALQSNTTGGGNTANGVGALLFNTTGNNNVAIGPDALENNTTGLDNIGLGVSAGLNLTTGFRNIDIGNQGVAGESNTLRIGDANQFRTFIAGIANVTLPSGVPVVVDTTTGQLGKGATSSRRFKDEIKPMEKASEAILALKPVTFRYKQEIDPKGIPQFGLVAEEVEKVNPDLITRDSGGKPETVRYEAVNAMLLNEFLKEHQKVQRLEAALAAVNERLKAQDAKIDKVNAKVELTKPAPQVVNDNH